MSSPPLNPQPVSPSACPLCGQPNACAMAARAPGEEAATPCWCTTVTFTAELLARVPVHAQRKACICQTCAQSERKASALA